MIAIFFFFAFFLPNVTFLNSTAENITPTQVEQRAIFILRTSQQTRNGQKLHFLPQNELCGADVHMSVTPSIHPGVFGFHCHVLVSVSDSSMLDIRLYV